MRNFLYLTIPVAVCFLVGFVAGQAQQLSIETWYPTLVKSPLTPPNVVFPIAWGILYLLMGLSIGLVLRSKSGDKRFLVALFSIQLLLNFMWSILFFRLQNPLAGFVDIVLLDSIVLFYIAKSFRNHKVSSILFVPYAMWILFASYLNLYVLIHN